MNAPFSASLVYGLPPRELAAVPPDAAQVSPLIPGSARLEDCAEGSARALVMLAAPGTIERRHALALALRALEPGGALTVMAPKDRGGARLAKELRALGLDLAEEARRHHRICTLRRPSGALPLAEALDAGAPRHIDNLALCTQPGVFSWDRIDPGTALLLETLPPLSGRGADLGCGLGILARAVLGSPAVTALTLVDIDRRAVEMARRNVVDPRASLRWEDLRVAEFETGRLDFVVMNPPFHDGGTEDQALGQTFVRRAAEMLRPGGALWVTANAHLPYEAVLRGAFREVTQRAGAGGYKVYEARR
ncbi:MULTISPECIES: methyltransferase [Methylobacterium]|uniref:Ribosomal RNA small subunit methyltransferase C n=1 Tax=Methylobacterium jeotgali TaxID=381630 RepID=A0ABQ4SSS8_9HYPH|nr:MULTISPECIES: methyltransferase [Methylobacterium]PIU06408.1 MAG: methyltransferase [Methylobacterium sp. CG09_land_8_20_14_0_10_71_15]PIU15848.1 MAG: methyltransferase [Methylobacterium sp. CG08_land_8_20_14_0_20_71_15]GBU18330.1 methyltransferase [Methylobacterium sp.]GJE04908.1 Ribosomal RNA small subunit methyltransferase C [Methylobacterium jeotgali]